MHDLAQLKRLLPLDALISKLGHAPIAKRKARCPFHEDKRESFSMYSSNGGFRWKCFAGCGEGDEINFVHKFFDLPDVKAAIIRYAEIVDGYLPVDAARKFHGAIVPAKVVAEPKPAGPPAKLEPLSLSAACRIGEWRGLSPKFLMDMTELGILGLYDNKPAFKADGGVQYRVPGDGWRYSAGAKTSLLILGNEDKWDGIYIVESNWDALALYESLHKDSRPMVLCTRGASNARLAIDYINAMSVGESMRVTIIPQNDDAGEKWTNDLKAGLMLHQIDIKRVPAPYKDFAEMHKDKKKQ